MGINRRLNVINRPPARASVRAFPILCAVNGGNGTPAAFAASAIARSHPRSCSLLIIVVFIGGILGNFDFLNFSLNQHFLFVSSSLEKSAFVQRAYPNAENHDLATQTNVITAIAGGVYRNAAIGRPTRISGIRVAGDMHVSPVITNTFRSGRRYLPSGRHIVDFGRFDGHSPI